MKSNRKRLCRRPGQKWLDTVLKGIKMTNEMIWLQDAVNRE